jgi:hypothetical protein
LLHYVTVENYRFKALGISVGVVDKAKSKSGKVAHLPISSIRKSCRRKLAKLAQKLS